MTVTELTDLKTTINWLLENGEFEDKETSYNIAMNSVDILEKQLSIPLVSNCLPTEKEWYEIRDRLTDEHIERLSRQTKFFNLRAGIEKGMDAIIDRIKVNCC